MSYFRKLIELIKTVLMAICGVALCILYGVFWLLGLLICIPFLIIIAIPFFLIAIFASFTMMTHGLTILDEDV